MKTLIIGSEGYIGSYLFQYLQSKGLDVAGYGNRSNDYNKLTSEYLEPFEYIVLLAGHSSVQMCNGDLKSSWLNNVVNFKNLVEKKRHETKLIYASSSSVYGNTNSKLFNEYDISLDFINNYDLTKVMLDLYANQQINYGMDIIGLRFGTVNGGSSVMRRDLMINSMVYNALNDNKIFVSNKEINRPILAISDLGRAVERIITNVMFYSGMYNIASFNSTVEDVSNSVKDILGVDVIDNGSDGSAYNFAISTAKFEFDYEFEFIESVSSVVEDVVDCYRNKNPKIVRRNEYFEYNG